MFCLNEEFLILKIVFRNKDILLLIVNKYKIPLNNLLNDNVNSSFHSFPLKCECRSSNRGVFSLLLVPALCFKLQQTIVLRYLFICKVYEGEMFHYLQHFRVDIFIYANWKNIFRKTYSLLLKIEQRTYHI